MRRRTRRQPLRPDSGDEMARPAAVASPGGERSRGVIGWLLTAVVLLGMVVAGVGLAWWVWRYLVIDIPIEHQAVGFRLADLAARLEAAENQGTTPQGMP